MENWQEEIRRRLEAFQRDKGNGFAVSVKFRVTHCFCREHCAPVANRLIDEYRTRHKIDPRYCEYLEHETGPEMLLLLGLIADRILGIAKSAIELATAIVKAKCEGEKKGDRQHGPLAIVVRGFDTKGRFYEKQVLEADPHAPPTKKAVEEALTGVIQLIAEERARQGAKGGPSPRRSPGAKGTRKKKRRGE